MKKIKEPNPQVIKFESMDVIATSGEIEVEDAGVTLSAAKGVRVAASKWGY